MLGAIAGDIIGSRFEHQPTKVNNFELFAPACRFTDDTVLTCAVADALLAGRPYAEALRDWYRRYPDAGYGVRFIAWGMSDSAGRYNSFGNGSAMRVSPVGWLFDDLETVLDEAEKSATVTHNHPEGVKGAQAVAGAILLARQGKKKTEIRQFIQQQFNYDLNRSLEEIRPGYRFDVSCQGSVPEAIICFLEADDFEAAIRNAISIGGDADTQAAITGSIAEACYGGVPSHIRRETMKFLPFDMRDILTCFQERLSQRQA